MATKITLAQAMDGLAAFMAGEVAKIPNLSSRFLAFGALGAIKANPNAVLDAYAAPLKMVGILDAENMVNLDAVKGALVSAFAEVPTFQAFGFTFKEDDAEGLLRHMNRAAG